MLVVDFEHCTGCGACLQACPGKCISWQSGVFGFHFPVIEETKCINCGKCDKVCQIGKETTKHTEQTAYAFVNEDSEILRQSTSGGAFTLIADYILDNNGIIYGCSMEPGLHVEHIRITGKEELKKLRGSKYVQSDLNNCYQQAKEDLDKGQLVLFSGTPCQIAGLQGYLGKEYENLITVDLVCHGVGSQAYFSKYLEYAKQQYKDISDLHFRDKEFAGWACGGGIVVSNTDAGEKHIPYYDYNNYYYFYFLSGDISRTSCYSCQYANIDRPGDFTLGDFWGIETLNTALDTNEGCSLLLVNTKKGRRIFEKFYPVHIQEVPIESAARMNKQLSEPSGQSSKRSILAKEFDELSAKEIHDSFVKHNKKRILKLRIKTAIPYKMRKKIRKYL